MDEYLKNFKNCLQKEVAYCVAECPFHLDVFDFIEKMKRESFKGAYKTYKNAVGFPQIVSQLCNKPCEKVCPRKDYDEPVKLNLLERACIEFTNDKSATEYNLPLKNKKVAIIGAGISGMACALRLCMKKYQVEIFEAEDRIGGYLWEIMEPEVFLTDINQQFEHENYKINFNSRISDVAQISSMGFDAVYVATGENGENFGLLEKQDENGNGFCAIYADIPWFAGGGVVGEETIYALANGLHMGTVIDNYLKTKNLFYPSNVVKTAMCLNHKKITKKEYKKPKNCETFNKTEAKNEAERCIECKCDFCRSYCDLTDYYNKWPLRIRDEIVATTLPGWADIKATPAKRLLSTCNQCGVCKVMCPEDIDIGGLILEGRKSMHNQGKAPWVFHDFWLRDMDFSNGPKASLAKKGEKFAFFPGCQMGAGQPDLVIKVYEQLNKTIKNVGLILRCCGAPAEWSGDQDKHKVEIEEIKRIWKEIERPTLILACPTCIIKFKTYLPEIPVVSLYEKIEEMLANGEELNEFINNKEIVSSIDNIANSIVNNDLKFSIFDPCSSRDEKNIQQAVRKIIQKIKLETEPLTENEEMPRCCSFGGQPGVANPEYAEFVAKKRITESDNPYIVYCINCRDVFLDMGKPTFHILELLFGTENKNRKSAGVSKRIENRIELKNYLIEKYWPSDNKNEINYKNIKLNISEELQKKIDKEKILRDEIIEAILYCEGTCKRIINKEKGSFSGYKKIGNMTFWVEYKPIEANENYEVINAYSHRITIEIEEVWNGIKVEKNSLDCQN